MTGLFVLIAFAAQQSTVELTHYRKHTPTAEQEAAYDTRDMDARIASLRNSIRYQARLTLRPGQVGNVSEGKMRGTATLVGSPGNRAVRLNVDNFYSGSPFFLRPAKCINSSRSVSEANPV